MTSFRLSLPLSVLVFAASPAGQQVPAGPADGAISGTVYDGVTHRPIAGVVVNLTEFAGPDGHADARVTDERGRFVFEGLGAERRSLTAHKPGYLESSYGRDGPLVGDFLGNVIGSAHAPVLLGPRQWLEEADLTLWPAASVSGTVTDEYGEPFVDQLVRVLALDPVAGHPRWSNVGTVVTDDRGRYFVGRLAAGRYVIAAPAAPPPESSASTVRPGRYYPGSLRLADATPVVVAAGAHLTGLDIARVPTPASRVSGRVTGAAGQNWPPLLLALTAAGDPDIGPTGYVATTLLQPNGTFVFPRVPPGAYLIRSSPSVGKDSAPIETFFFGPQWSLGTPPNKAPWTVSAPLPDVSAPYFAHTSVTVGDADVPNVVVALEDAVTLSGVVTPDVPFVMGPGGTPLFWVHAEPATPDAGPASKDIWLDADGAFVIDGLAPGAYFLRTTPSRTPVRSIRVGGRELIDQPIDASESVAGISVAVTDAASMHGAIRAGSTSASVRTAVIYFSSDRQLWTQVSSQSPRFGSTYVNTDGTYDTFAVLPGGDYDVVAVPQDPWLDTWRSEAFLEAAAGVATTVHVEWAQRVQQDLHVQDIRLR